MKHRVVRKGKGKGKTGVNPNTRSFLFLHNLGVGDSSLEFGEGRPGRIGVFVSQGRRAVGTFDRSVGAHVTAFPGGVSAFVGGGCLNGVADCTERCKSAALFVVEESLAVAELGIYIDGGVILKAAGGIEGDEATNADGTDDANRPVSKGGKDHRQKDIKCHVSGRESHPDNWHRVSRV